MKTGLHALDTTQNQLTPEAPRLLSDVLRGGLDIKLHLLQHYAELARLLAREILDEEVGCLCGRRYSRDKPLGGRYRRWGSNPGSIRIQHERVPIDVPRARDVAAGSEHPPQSYRQVKEPIVVDQRLEEAILLGLSQPRSTAGWRRFSSMASG